jgi:hypothetical protein
MMRTSEPDHAHVEINGADGDAAYNFAVTSKTLKKGSTPKDHLQQALNDMAPHGVTAALYPAALFATPVYPRAVSWFANTKDVLRTLAQSMGCTWSIQQGVLHMIPEKSTTAGDAITLNSTTGMIGLPQETEGGIQVRSLLNSRLKINGKVQINQASIQRAALDPSLQTSGSNVALQNLHTGDGTYKILYLEHVGDTRGPDWFTDLICVGVTGSVSASVAGRLPSGPTLPAAPPSPELSTMQPSGS